MESDPHHHYYHCLFSYATTTTITPPLSPLLLLLLVLCYRFHVHFSLNETMDQLAMVDSVRWYGHVLRKGLDLEVDGQRVKGNPMRMWKRQVEEESVEVGLRREDALPIKVVGLR